MYYVRLFSYILSGPCFSTSLPIFTPFICGLYFILGHSRRRGHLRAFSFLFFSSTPSFSLLLLLFFDGMNLMERRSWELWEIYRWDIWEKWLWVEKKGGKSHHTLTLPR